MPKRPSTTTEVSLSGFYKWSTRKDCLELITREITRLNGDENVLLPYQISIYRDLWNPLDEEALAEMLNYWEYDLEALFKRGRGYGTRIPGKPRIDVNIELTSKDNLKAEWFPRGINFWGQLMEPEATSDFVNWQRFPNRRQSFGSRPSNELFFIHNVRYAVGSIQSPLRYPANKQLLDHVFLRACSCVVEELKERLEHHFDVRMNTDIFVEWQPSEAGLNRTEWDEPVPFLKEWEIASPSERQAEAERLELASMEQTHGVSTETLLIVWLEELESTRNGLARKSYTLPDRIVRNLKVRSFKITKGQVERAMKLLQIHQPSLCPNLAT